MQIASLSRLNRKLSKELPVRKTQSLPEHDGEKHHKALDDYVEKTEIRWDRSFSGSTMASVNEYSDPEIAENSTVLHSAELEPSDLEPEAAALLLPALRRIRQGAPREERRRLSKEIAYLEGTLGISSPVPDPVTNLFCFKADGDDGESLKAGLLRKMSKEATVHIDQPEPVSDHAAELLLPSLRRIRSQSLSLEERSHLNGEIQGLEEKLGIQMPRPDPESWVVHHKLSKELPVQKAQSLPENGGPTYHKSLDDQVEKKGTRGERSFSGTMTASVGEHSDSPTAEISPVLRYTEPEQSELEREAAALLLPALRRMRHGAPPEERCRLSKETANLEGTLGISSPVPGPVPNLFRCKGDGDGEESLKAELVCKTSKEATAHADQPEPMSHHTVELLLPSLRRIRSQTLSLEERRRLNGEIQGLEEKLGIKTPSPDPESWVVKSRTPVLVSNPAQKN